MSGCSSDDADSPSDPLSQLAPTQDDIATEAGLVFPERTTEFRVVRLSGTNINVSFRSDTAAVDGFLEGSGLSLEPGQRVIRHASPVWDLNPGGAISGGTDTQNGIRRDVEVVTGDGDPIVRISLVTG